AKARRSVRVLDLRSCSFIACRPDCTVIKTPRYVVGGIHRRPQPPLSAKPASQGLVNKIGRRMPFGLLASTRAFGRGATSAVMGNERLIAVFGGDAKPVKRG